MKLSESPVTQHQFEGLSFFLKRDDLLHQQFSGNKARKFMSLLNGDYPGIKRVVGYGSVQANSLYSLAALCAFRKWQLLFYVDHIPSYVRDKPLGNYRGAMELGARIIDLSASDDRNGRHCADYTRDLYTGCPDTLLIPEGGRSPIAEAGIKGLAQEILNWQMTERIRDLVVALPSGTGTTALYLQKHLHKAGIKVLTCACVGDATYLKKQFQELDAEAPQPEILNQNNKHQFGRLYEEQYHLWQELEMQTQIEFDLLYDPFMWQSLQTWLPENRDKTLLYVHQGGILGNETMTGRYRRWLQL